MLRYTREEFVQGAMPFNLKADVYNSVHGYAYTCGSLKDEESEDDGVKESTPCGDSSKRFKRKKW